MRKYLIPLAASLAIATPALANEARIEGRGGVIWNNQGTDPIAGVAVGYDWDLGSSTFVGAEVSGDKIIKDGTRISVGVGGRIGARIGTAGKLYGVGAWQTKPCRLCEDSIGVGAGYEHSLGQNLYGKVEYRHNIVGNNVSDTDVAGVGLGMRF